MKNLFKSLLSFVAVAASFVACNPEQPIDVPAGTVISVDLTQEQLANLPAKDVPAVTFNVTSDGEWLATSPAWITIDPSHAKGNATVTITVADNVDAEGKLQGPRAGTVTLSLVDAEVSVEITVQQLGDESLDTRRTYKKVTAVTPGKAYLLVAVKGGKNYIPTPIKAEKSYGYPEGKPVVINEDGSITMDDASYGLIFADGGRDAAFTIQQPDGRYIWHDSSFNTWSVAENPATGNLWKLDHLNEDGTVRFSNVDDGYLLTFSHVNAQGGDPYTTFACYRELDEETVLPFLYEDTKAAVIDDSKCFFPSTSVKVAADSVKATFAVTANIPWELTNTEGDWITDFTPKSGSADATITVTFPANTADGAEAREAKFHLASTDGKKTADLTLTQGSPAVFTLADVVAGEVGVEYTVKDAVVLAVGGSNRIVYDGTAYMLAYGATGSVKPVVGDKVVISGKTKEWNQVLEWDNPAFTVTAQGVEVKHPEAAVLDTNAFNAYAKESSIKYISAEGVRKEGQYFVLNIGTEKSPKELNIYGTSETEAGKQYTVTGYTVGYNSKYSQINLALVSYEEVEIEYAQFELSEAAAEVEAAAGSKTFKVVAADNVGWTVALPADVTGARLAIAGVEDGSLSAKGTKDVVITYAENKAAGPVEYKVTVTAAADAVVENKTLVYALTQKAPEGSVALTFQWAEDTDVADTVAFTAGTYTWTVNADAAVEYEVSILGADGTVLVKGTDFTVENNVITFPYAVNKNPAYVTWRVMVTTANENAETKSLEATLVQGPYEYSDLKELNADIIASGRNVVDRIVVISEAAKLYVTKKDGRSVFLQSKHSEFTGGVLLYLDASDPILSKLYECVTINGRFTATTTSYNGVPEVTKIAFNQEDVTIGKDQSLWPCETVTVSGLQEDYNKYVNAKVKILNVDVTTGFSPKSKTGEIKDNTGSITLYVKSNSVTIEVPTNTTAHQVTVFPTYYNENKQVGLWANGGVWLKNVPCTMSFTKDEVSVAMGDSIALGAKSLNPGTIVYEITSGDDVVTVSDKGMVKPLKTGSATIKASVPQTETTDKSNGYKTTYTAAEATCAVTVTDEGAGGGEPEVDPYSIDLTYSLGSNAFDDGVATINGKADVKVIKIGSSSAKGDFTVVIPAGTKKITYYAVGWKGKNTTLDFQIGGASAAKQALVANDGAANSAPFTITVTDSDKYEIVNDFAAETRVTVTTTTNARAILWGFKAE